MLDHPRPVILFREKERETLLVVVSLFVCLFVEMNCNRGGLQLKKSITFLKEETHIASGKWMVVLDKETYLEMGENLKILSRRK